MKFQDSKIKVNVRNIDGDLLKTVYRFVYINKKYNGIFNVFTYKNQEYKVLPDTSETNIYVYS